MGSFLMLLAVLMKWAGILQMQLLQINENEESSNITITVPFKICNQAAFSIMTSHHIEL